MKKKIVTIIIGLILLFIIAELLFYLFKYSENFATGLAINLAGWQIGGWIIKWSEWIANKIFSRGEEHDN